MYIVGKKRKTEIYTRKHLTEKIYTCNYILYLNIVIIYIIIEIIYLFDSYDLCTQRDICRHIHMALQCMTLRHDMGWENMNLEI